MQDSLYIVFSADNGDALTYSDGKRLIKKVKNFHELSALEFAKPAVFTIASGGIDYAREIIRNIRTHAQYHYWLCFADTPIDEHDANLFDGVNLTGPQKEVIVKEFGELDAAFKFREEPLFRDDRLLRYVWTRRDFVIRPFQDWRQPRNYVYPLLQALAFEETDVFDWIKSLLFKSVLEQDELLDRQRECPYCFSAHLSFADVCPNCQSRDITEQVALHCFTCGQVGPQEEFLRHGALGCPKCGTQLKHIGSDYDRPLENHSCRQCRHFFIEGQVKARCLICSKTLDTEELAVHEISTYRLSEHGRISALRGAVADVLAVFSGSGFIANEIFVHDLDWLLLQGDRYPGLNFAVVGIYFANIHELLNRGGQAKLLLKIEGIAERIREILREPDLCTRSVDNVIWLLLPHTGGGGVNVLLARLGDYLETVQADQETSSRLKCKFVKYLAEQRQKQEPAELLLARLRNDLL